MLPLLAAAAQRNDQHFFRARRLGKGDAVARFRRADPTFIGSAMSRLMEDSNYNQDAIMSKAIESLQAAQQRAMAIRPKSVSGRNFAESA